MPRASIWLPPQGSYVQLMASSMPSISPSLCQPNSICLAFYDVSHSLPSCSRAAPAMGKTRFANTSAAQHPSQPNRCGRHWHSVEEQTCCAGCSIGTAFASPLRTPKALQMGAPPAVPGATIPDRPPACAGRRAHLAVLGARTRRVCPSPVSNKQVYVLRICQVPIQHTVGQRTQALTMSWSPFASNCSATECYLTGTLVAAF